MSFHLLPALRLPSNFVCLGILTFWFNIPTTVIAQQKKDVDLDVKIAKYEIQYDFKWKRDVPIFVGGIGLIIAGETVKNNVPVFTEAQINALNADDIGSFDQSAIDNDISVSANYSDIGLGISALTPFALFAFRPVRQEFFPVLMTITETALTINGLTSLSKGAFKRARPFTYNSDVALSKKLTVNARHSFFSGHTANAAAYSFMTAHLIDRYTKRKWVRTIAWSTAIVLPATVGYLRYAAGKHFPTDVIVGYAVGAGVGLLIPQLHRAQLPEKKFSMDMGMNGLYFCYKFQ